MALLDSVPEMPRPVALIPIGEEAEREAFTLLARLRHGGICVDMAYGGNTGKRFKRADKIRAYAAVVIGEEERAAGKAKIKWLDSGKEDMVALSQLERVLHSAGVKE